MFHSLPLLIMVSNFLYFFLLAALHFLCVFCYGLCWMVTGLNTTAAVAAAVAAAAAAAADDTDVLRISSIEIWRTHKQHKHNNSQSKSQLNKYEFKVN